MKRPHNAGFLSAVIAGRREKKREGGPFNRGSENRPSLGSPALLPATKAELDRYDLRLAWLTCAVLAGRPAGIGEGGGQGAGSDSAADTGDPSSSLPAEEDDEPEPLTADEVKNPRMKRLSDEAAKRRRQVKAEKERADAAEVKVKELEGKTNTEALLGQVREGQMENAFLKVAMGKVSDLEAAWKLADKAGVTITNEGVVEGLDAVLAKVLEKHPYLAPKPTDPNAEALAEQFPALLPSGRPNNGKKGGTDSVDYSVLEKRFPALRGRR